MNARNICKRLSQNKNTVADALVIDDVLPRLRRFQYVERNRSFIQKTSKYRSRREASLKLINMVIAKPTMVNVFLSAVTDAGYEIIAALLIGNPIDPYHQEKKKVLRILDYKISPDYLPALLSERLYNDKCLSESDKEAIKRCIDERQQTKAMEMLLDLVPRRSIHWWDFLLAGIANEQREDLVQKLVKELDRVLNDDDISSKEYEDDSDFDEIDDFNDDSDKEWTNGPWHNASEHCTTTIQSEGIMFTPNSGLHDNIRASVYKRNDMASPADLKSKMSVKDKIKLFDSMENKSDRAEPFLRKGTKSKPRNYEDSTKSEDIEVAPLNQLSRRNSRSEHKTYGSRNNLQPGRQMEGKYKNPPICLGKQLSDKCIQPEEQSFIIEDNAQPSTGQREMTLKTREPAEVTIPRENKKRVSFLGSFVDLVASSVQSFKDIFNYPMIM